VATGDDADDARSDVALAPTTPGVGNATHSAGGTETSPGRVIAPPTAAGDDSMLRQGDSVDRYRIEGYLGRGGMGVVYRARDPDLDRALAIKLVRSRHRGGDRMLREAQAMARLDHPNVVPIFDVGVRGEQIFLVMPFMPGGTLGDWCRQRARPWRDVVRRYIEAGRGLEAAHRAGIVHRDFKPDNVLIDSNDEVHVADFGLARAQRDDSSESVEPIVEPSGPLGYALTRAGELLGTPAYMSPEQLDGKTVDARADQFSFCVALHEGLYGKRPFEMPKGGNIVDHRRAIADARVRPAPADRTVPSWIRDAIVRGVREDPAARWPTMTALLDELERGLERRRRGRPASGARVLRRVAIATAAVSAVAVGAVWFATTRGGHSRGTHAVRSSDTAPLGEPYKARAITFRGDIDFADLSPDGTQVAAIAGNDLVLVPTAPGGELRTLLTKLGGDLEALSWSADGKRVLLTSRVDLERTRLRIVDVESGAVEDLERAAWARAAFSGPREIASVLSTERSVRITPLDQDQPSRRCPLTGEIEWVSDILAAGGALFVIVAHHDQAFTVERTDRNCVAPRAVLDHVPPGEVIVSLDGTQVGIRRSRDREVFVEWHDVDGRAVQNSRPFTADVDDLVGRMPDGRIVAESARSSWQLVPLAGGDAIGVGSAATRVVVSPDRTKAVIIDSRDEHWAVRVVPLAHLDARPAPVATDILTVAWSPDGAWLAVVHDVGGKTELAAIQLATGTWTPLPAGDVSAYSQVTWLDDKRIAYLRADHRTFVAIDRETLETSELLDPAPGWTFELAASPADGTLAVHWEREKNGVYIVGPDGAATMVAPGGRIRLAWSTDGKTLWSAEQNLGVIHRYDRATGKTELVRTISLDRNTMITSLVPMPDGSVLVKIDRDTRDLVVLE
jgi:tRNA A-37 threonylcarbamoyl transferase component Bud32/WD40 repeat protein